MDVEQAAAGEDLLELVPQQLIHAGAAGDDHRVDVEVVQRVGDAVEEHAVVGGDLLALIRFAGGDLRVAAAEIAGRQHRLRADVIEHRLRRQAHLREQPLRAATGEVEDGVAVVVVGTHLLRIADHRDDLFVLDVEQRARGALGQAAGHRLVDEVDDLRANRRRDFRRLAERRRWLLRLPLDQPKRLGDAVGQALALVAPADHQRAHGADRRGVLHRQESHRRRLGRHDFLLALLAQEIAHADRDVAEVDVDRAWIDALVTDRAVVGDVVELVEVHQRDAASRLLLVEESLDQQRGGEDLVAWRVEQVGARHVRRAHRLALAAAQAVLDHCRDVADFGLLHDQRLGAQ